MSTQGRIAQEKPCTRCKETKPLTEFHRRTFRNGREGRTSECKPCRIALRQALSRTERGRERNRINAAKHYRKLRSQAKLALALPGEKLDVLRKALVEKPPALESEGERLAYFRGLMAGVKRNTEETERFERLKDLPHRIACERTSQVGIGYEEAISAAYEGLLAFMRRGRYAFASEASERKMAALSIRRAIIDYKRMEGPVDRHMNPRYIGGKDPQNEDGESLLPTLAQHEDEEDGGDIWEEIRRRLQERADKGVRLEQILRWRLQGLTQGECAERLGITESRVCQILANERPWLEKHILPLCGEALSA